MIAVYGVWFCNQERAQSFTVACSSVVEAHSAWVWVICPWELYSTLFHFLSHSCIFQAERHSEITEWCTVSFKKVLKRKNMSFLEETLEERIWKTLFTPLFESPCSFLDVASNSTVNLVLGKLMTALWLYISAIVFLHAF